MDDLKTMKWRFPMPYATRCQANTQQRLSVSGESTFVCASIAFAVHTYIFCLVVVVIVVQFSPSNRVLWRPAPNWWPEDEARARCCDCNRRPHELHWCDCGFCASVQTRMFVWVCVVSFWGCISHIVNDIQATLTAPNPHWMCVCVWVAQ